MKNTLFSLAILLTMLTVPTLAQQANYDADIAAFEAQDKATPPPADGILFVGSSSIRLWNGLKEAFPGKPIIQRGFGGSTLSDVIRYMPRVILPYKPKQVVVYAGDNDIAQNKTARDIYSQFLSFFAVLRKQLPNTNITYISVKPSPSRRQQMPVQAEANRMIKQYIGGQKNASFVDVYTPMLGANGQPRPELFVADSLHMNAQGYEIWKSAVGPVLK